MNFIRRQMGVIFSSRMRRPALGARGWSRAAGRSASVLLQADQVATLCLYALSDIYIHYDGYTPEQLSTFLKSYGFPQESSDLIYQTLLAEPGAYLPYAVGYLEFMELRERAEQKWGTEYSDYQFHEFLLETGPMPFEMLGELLDAQ